MKETIMIMDQDQSYSKRFCNQAIKLMGKKYTFLNFTSINSMRNYASENKVESLIVSDDFVENIEDIKVNSYYILNEKEKNVIREGKKSYIYKLQSVVNILDVLDKDIEKKYENNRVKTKDSCKLVLFYSPTETRNRLEIIKRIAKQLVRKKKVLIVDLEEFSNYKGSVGLSNVIFNYKENNINKENLMHEIVSEKDQDFILSTTYPEDFNVVTNIDLANIVNEIVKLNYDYVFINADKSFVKCQYILADSDTVVLFRDKDVDKFDKFRTYLKNENQIDMKKISIIDVQKIDKSYITAFSKQFAVKRTA